MEAGEYGLTNARRLDVVAVARLLWVSWCVLVAAGFRVCVCVCVFVFVCVFVCVFLRTRTACCKYEATLPHLPLSLTRVTKIYLLALGTTQISSYFTKHWTKFLTHQTGNYPVTCFVSKPSRITLVELSYH